MKKNARKLAKKLREPNTYLALAGNEVDVATANDANAKVSKPEGIENNGSATKPVATVAEHYTHTTTVMAHNGSTQNLQRRRRG